MSKKLVKTIKRLHEVKSLVKELKEEETKLKHELELHLDEKGLKKDAIGDYEVYKYETGYKLQSVGVLNTVSAGQEKLMEMLEKKGYNSFVKKSLDKKMLKEFADLKQKGIHTLLKKANLVVTTGEAIKIKLR